MKYDLLIWDKPAMVKRLGKYINDSRFSSKINILKQGIEKKLKVLDLKSPIRVHDIVIADINKVIEDEHLIIEKMRLINPDMQLLCIGGKNNADAAWNYECNSYIIKPFTKEDFLTCLECRLFKYEQIQLANKYMQNFSIKQNSKWIKLNYTDILYFEKVRKKIRVVTKDNDYSFYGTLKSLCDAIDMDCFFHCHQGYIINRQKMKKFKEDEILLEGSNASIPVSRRMRKAAVDFFNELNKCK